MFSIRNSTGSPVAGVSPALRPTPGGLRLVDVLAARAARTVVVPLAVGGFDLDLDGVVHGRRYEYRREGCLPLVVGVEGRQAHHTVHAVLALEVTVGIFALDLQRA